MLRFTVLAGLLLLAHAAQAIPPGYRYIGSLVVSGGRHVFWYWNAEFFQPDASGTGFVAQMYARNVESAEERSLAAVVRCDSRTYRRADSKDPFERIEEGDPIFAVWRAGCDAGRAVSLALRLDRLNGGASAVAASPASAAAASPARPSVSAAVDKLAEAPRAPAAPAVNNAPAPGNSPVVAVRTDERHVDSCVRFAESTASQFGDATITNTCKFPVEVGYCYKGGRGGIFDCPSPLRTMRADSLGPGVTHNLPEYRRAKNSGVALVACKGEMGTVFPVLNGDGGKPGCR